MTSSQSPSTPADPITIEVSRDSTADAARIWALWTDVENWPRWDHALTSATIDGPFASGTHGRMSIHGQGELAFVMTAVEPGRGYADETPIPGGGVHFQHRVEPRPGGGVRVTHRAEVTGEPAIARAIADQIEQGLPSAVAALVALAETP